MGDQIKIIIIFYGGIVFAMFPTAVKEIGGKWNPVLAKPAVECRAFREQLSETIAMATMPTTFCN